MNWFMFWVIHPAVFLPAALFFPATFFKIDWVNKVYLNLLNFDWYAMPILYPIVGSLFIFTATPYLTKSDLERSQEAFGARHEAEATWIYLSMIAGSLWVQIRWNKELQEWYFGPPENECDYFIDGYCTIVEEEPEEEDPDEFYAESF